MIFNLFKSKPTLKELIPEGFVDIHSHVLPGIDDGSKNINESLDLISEMKKMGFSKIIGTPHTYSGVHNNTNKTIIKSYNSLKSKLNFEIKLGFASEYMLEKNLIEKAENKSILCLSENYVLVEMSYSSMPIEVYDIIFKLNANDYIPVLAHPERYLYLQNDFNDYTRLKKYGCLFQINLLSANGFYGPAVTKSLNYLIKKGLVDFVGSDFHKMRQINAMKNKIKVSTRDLEKVILKNNQFK